MKRLRLVPGLVLAGLSLCLPAVAKAADGVSPATKNPPRSSPAVLAAGSQIYAAHCAGCHGDELAGGIGPDLTDRAWVHGGKAGDIYRTIHDGTPNGMPKWNDRLKPDEIWQLVAYIQSKASH